MNWRVASLVIAGGTIAVLVAANAHLVYVALASQPDCMPHERTMQDDGGFRAARSSC